jgi:hypothetical protein
LPAFSYFGITGHTLPHIKTQKKKFNDHNKNNIQQQTQNDQLRKKMRRPVSPASLSFHHLPQEIQDMIFVLLSRHDAAVCALVCQAWFEVFVPVLLDSFSMSSPSPGVSGGFGNDVDSAAGGEGGGTLEVRRILDAYQRMTGWLLAQGRKEEDDTAQQGFQYKDDNINLGSIMSSRGLMQAPEPIIPVVLSPTVEQVLRNSDGLRDVWLSGWWRPIDSTGTAGKGIAVSTTSTAGEGARAMIQDSYPSIDKRQRPPYPLCRLDSLQITINSTTSVKDQRPTLLSLLECRHSTPLSPCSSSTPSSSSSPLSIQDRVGLRLGRTATISLVSMNPARLLYVLPATLSKIVLESIDCNRVTGMFAASWRTIENSSSGQLQEEEEEDGNEAYAGRTEGTSQANRHEQQQTEFRHLRRIHLSCFQLDKSVLIPFLRRFNNLQEIHLCLPRTMQPFSKAISNTLSTSCPFLNVGVFGGQEQDLSDQNLAYLIGSSAQGWRTLAVDTHCMFGPLTAAAVVRGDSGRHVRTLENFRVTTGILDFPSPMIQELLCTATKLKRFEGRSLHRDWTPMIHLSAADMVQGEWACKDLETFHCAIRDIPRPDIKTQKNGRPLVGRLHRGDSMEESFRVQRLVYEQLGRLTKLRELVVGYRYCDGDERFGSLMTDEDWGWEQGITEAEYYSPTNSSSTFYVSDAAIEGDDVHMEDVVEEGEEVDKDLPTGLLYDCLAMSLESGLELLGRLKELKWLSLEGISHCVKDVERKWMETNWPGLFLEDEIEREGDSGSGGGGGVVRDVFWKKYMICGYHATEPWYNNWEDIEANV